MRNRFRITDSTSFNPKPGWVEVNDSHIVILTDPRFKFMMGWNMSDVQAHVKKFNWRIENDRAR